jgi:Phosphotransferase enzyme family
MSAEIPPRAMAERLMAAAGVSGPILAVQRLSGGRNNLVWRVDSVAGDPLILKQYHHSPDDPRDRLGAEWSFLQYAWVTCGLRNIPRPLAQDASHHVGLFGFLPGRRLLPTEIDASAVAAAANFIVCLNRQARGEALPAASEACFSMASHVATVSRRVARLDAGLDPTAPLAEASAALVRERLVPAWVKLEAGLGTDEAVLPACVSPSDFGFHNALAEGTGRLGFLDFEYAGRDDPAKLICDFCCQPEVPVPAALHADFRDRVLAGLGLDQATHRARCDALLPAYRLKWACIMLNDFLPTGAARRAFATLDSRASRCAKQLEKARALLDSL